MPIENGIQHGSPNWIKGSNLGRMGKASDAIAVPDDVAAEIKARYETGPGIPAATQASQTASKPNGPIG